MAIPSKAMSQAMNGNCNNTCQRINLNEFF